MDGSLDLEGIRRIPNEFYLSMRAGHLEPGDVLINKDGAQTGKVAQYGGEYPEAAINEHLFLLRSSTAIDQGYLFRVLFSDEIQRDIKSLITGSAQPGLNRVFLKRVRLPVPPLKEQKHIAEILDSLDQTIQATEQLITKHRKIRQGLAHDLLKNTVNNTLSYYADINSENLGSDTPKDFRFEYLELSNVSNGSVIRVEKMTFGAAPSRARRIARKGDFLFGTVRPLQKSHAWATKDCIASTGFAVLRAKQGQADSRFLGHFLLTEEVTLLASKFAVGSGYPALGERDLAAFQFPDLPLEKQKRIAAILDSADLAIQENEAELAKLQKLRSGLASDLLSGRVRTVAA